MKDDDDKGNVIKFYHSNAGVNPDSVLEQAVGVYTDVLIIGWDKTESLDVRMNTGMKKKDILWLMEQFKHKLLNGDYG